MIDSGAGRSQLAADVNADGTGNDGGVGTLSIGAGATVTSTNPAADAITLRGADINIDTSANPAVVGALRQLNTTPTATLTGLNGPSALAFDSSGNLYVANSATATTQHGERVRAGEHHCHRHPHRARLAPAPWRSTPVAISTWPTPKPAR